MKLEYKNGLLFSDMSIGYKGKRLLLKNVVVDTGAAHTIINPDSVYELWIKAEANDEFITMYGVGGEHYSYRKNIHLISIGTNSLENVKVDFGLIDEEGYINNCIFGAFVLFPYDNEEEFKNNKFYKSIEEVNIGAIPFLPSTTKLMEDFLDEIIDESSYSSYERAIEPIGKDDYLKDEYFRHMKINNKSKVAMAIFHQARR